jgi:hypothetical protein
VSEANFSLLFSSFPWKLVAKNQLGLTHYSASSGSLFCPERQLDLQKLRMILVHTCIIMKITTSEKKNLCLFFQLFPMIYSSTHWFSFSVPSLGQAHEKAQLLWYTAQDGFCLWGRTHRSQNLASEKGDLWIVLITTHENPSHGFEFWKDISTFCLSSLTLYVHFLKPWK